MYFYTKSYYTFYLIRKTLFNSGFFEICTCDDDHCRKIPEKSVNGNGSASLADLIIHMVMLRSL